ncbi:MAG: hypothetical protein NT031_02295 [Planctomycetota bacterium]|nr:hypothetical protein [Planctomycetota bacterium]
MGDFRKAVELKRASMDKEAVKALSGPADAARDPKIAKEIDELSEYWSRYISFLQFLRLKQRIEPEAIIQAYQDASVSMPSVPDFYVGLGNFMYRSLGTDERLKAKYKPQAIELFKNAIKVSPTAAVGYLAWTEILINDGIRFKQAGQKDQAAAMYEKAMAILGEARKNTEELHRICHAQAIVFEQQGKFAEGINAYRQAIDELQKRSASQPASRGARTMQAELVKGMTGELYYRLGHALLNDAARKEEKDRQALIDEASKCLTAMRELTKDATAVNLEVRLEILTQKYDQAYRILEKTYRTSRNVLTLQNTMLLADLCMSRGVPTMAQDILKDMPEPAEAEPAIQVLLLKARCRSILNDAAGANSLLDEVLKREPENATALKMKAQMDTGKERQEALAKWREGLRDPAIRDMERICQQRPNDVQAIRELATMYDTAGRRADLLAMLEAARKRMPEDKSIQMACAVYLRAASDDHRSLREEYPDGGLLRDERPVGAGRRLSGKSPGPQTQGRGGHGSVVCRPASAVQVRRRPQVGDGDRQGGAGIGVQRPG